MYDGLFVLYILAFFALIGAMALAIYSIIHGFEGSRALSLLHLLGVIFAVLIVALIPGVAVRANPNTKTEQDGAEQRR